MQGPEFQESLARLLRLEEQRRTAIMCAEALPWRCHRSLIADAVTARGIPVWHIMTESKADAHRLTSFARVEGGQVTYPATDLELDATACTPWRPYSSDSCNRSRESPWSCPRATVEA